MPTHTQAAKTRFCSDCGTQLNPDARFCHACGSPLQGRSSMAPLAAGFARGWWWGVPSLAIFVLCILVIVQLNSRGAGPDSAGAVPLAADPLGTTDISSMSPEERADRLFNRVMRYSSEGKADSAAFFAPMALASIEALAPLDAHRRYDIGLIALAAGDVPRARAQGDTILAQRPTHLLGLMLAARVADARGDAATAKKLRRRLLAAEPAERKQALPEYTDHDTDIRAALELARKG
jgi:tetratricopeptide (TPR) repeat protein